MRIRELTNRTKLLLTASAVGALVLGGILPAAASTVDVDLSRTDPDDGDDDSILGL